MGMMTCTLLGAFCPWTRFKTEFSTIHCREQVSMCLLICRTAVCTWGGSDAQPTHPILRFWGSVCGRETSCVHHMS